MAVTYAPAYNATAFINYPHTNKKIYSTDPEPKQSRNNWKFSQIPKKNWKHMEMMLMEDNSINTLIIFCKFLCPSASGGI